MEAIASASNQLAFRKGDLEEHLRLTHELKVNHSFQCCFGCPNKKLLLLSSTSLLLLVCNAISRLTYGLKRANQA